KGRKQPTGSRFTAGSDKLSRLARAGELASTIDADRLSGDPGGAFAGEEEDQLGDLLRSPYPAQRMRAFAALQEASVGLSSHAAGLVQGGHHHSGIHGVHANALGREFQRGAARELIS